MDNPAGAHFSGSAFAIQKRYSPFTAGIFGSSADTCYAPNIRLLLEYDGTRYHGWQRQLDAATIQGVLEAAVARLTQAPVAIIGSGRTDAGVHARGQVANFRTQSAIPLKAFHQGLNSLLPKDIAVL